LGNIYRLAGKYLPIWREIHNETTHRLLAVSQLVQAEATGLFVVFFQGKPHLAIFITPQ
jgi:hypothetical protein